MDRSEYIAQLTAALRDRGWGDAAGLAEGEELLRQENARLWDYLRGVTPDFSLYDAFLVRQDYHNLKATIKGVLSGIRPPAAGAGDSER